MKSLFWSIILLLFSNTLFAQANILKGGIVVGKKELMSYKIVYDLDEHNVLTGYSINDVNGNLETKAMITGSYNPKNKSLKFEEKNILSTRTSLPFDQFCLMKVSGKFEKKAGKLVYLGNFQSKSLANKVICDSGSIFLTSEKSFNQIAKKASKIIKKLPIPDSIKRETNEKINAIVEVKKLKELAPASNTEFDLKSDSLRLDLFDDKIQDGDKVTVLKNNIRVVTDYEITSKVKSLRFRIGKEVGEVTFTIIADNEGSVPPTTVKAILWNGNEQSLIVANLKKGQSVKLTFKRTHL